MADFLLFLPETAVLVAALIALIATIAEIPYKAVWYISVVCGAAVLAVTGGSLYAEGQPFFDGIYLVDGFSQLLKLGMAVGLFLTLLSNGEPGSFRERTRTEVPVFLFMSTAGMMMLVSATELLTFYVALELSAYGLYILAALNRSQREGSEVGAKYVLFGAASSAVSLYGISLIFAVTKSTYFADLVAFDVLANLPLLLVGVLMLLAGLLFKLGAFPFHAWVPDTYQGAPHQAATFIGTVSKVAAVGVVVRVLSSVAIDPGYLTEVLLVLCVLSMTVGNLAALVQRDIKRLIAYSTVAHAGYMLIGLASFSTLGMASAIFYGVVYVPIVFCAFLAVSALGRDGTNPTLDSITGLYKRDPLMALVLLIGMFGLAGIPPTVGFAGKWFLFSAALEQGMFWLVLVAAVNATISLYYYLQIVRAAYLPAVGDDGAHLDDEHSEHDGDDADGDERTRWPFSYVLAGICAIGLVGCFGFYPAPLWDFAIEAARLVLGG